MRILVACEESQTVCKAFRDRGHEAYSCDILKESGKHPEWHICGDVIPLLKNASLFCTENGEFHYIRKWDMIIAFPPCTYLTVTGNKWFDTAKYGQKAWDRMKERNKAIGFFYKFVLADCEKVAIENPVGVMSTAYRHPDQIIQPYYFGEPFEKKTCLWLKGLPKLNPTEIVEPPKRKVFGSGRTMPEWYANAFSMQKEERAKYRSKTFEGIAKAMAEQWG